MKCVLASTFVLGGSNVFITGYGMFASNPDVQQLFDIYLRPASQHLPGIFYFKVFLLFITTLNTIVTTLSLTFYVIVCYVLYKEFEYLRRTLATKITVEGYFSDDLEKFRLRHQKRCQLVEEADQLFKFYIANTYLTNIPLLCLLLFGIVYTPNFANRLISAFRCVYVMTQVLTVTISATIINTQVGRPFWAFPKAEKRLWMRVDEFIKWCGLLGI